MLLLVCKDQSIQDHWGGGLESVSSTFETVFNAEGLIGLIESDKPSHVLLDLEVEGLEREALVPLLEQFSSVSFFVMSARPSPEEGVVLVGAGARGYGNRLMHPEVLQQAMQVIYSGELWLGSELILHLIKNTRLNGTQLPDKSAESKGGKLELLTNREKEIALRVGDGKTNKAIAYDLGITERTVKAHLSTIFRKTDTRDRLQLALLAKGHG
jgi:two-component system nitrate/nitrite response regulator NarL